MYRILRLIEPSLELSEIIAKYKVQSLAHRRQLMCDKLYKQCKKSTHRLHHFIPPERQQSRTFRNARRTEHQFLRTERALSFFPYKQAALENLINYKD